jgi:non-ribosomal peptide synthase protein (TIGR01720 family)
VAFFDFGPERFGRLLIVIHHLAIDGVSWRILLEDLQIVYEHLDRSQVAQLPPKTTSFKQWAERLNDYALSPGLGAEQDYWLSGEWRKIRPLPVDHLRGENTERSADTVSVLLSVAETQALLQDVPAAYGTQINDVLLTALLQAFEQWTGDSRLLISLEGHGREQIIEGVDLSRTVGWFTAIFPVLLKLNDTDNPGAALGETKEQLRAVPNRGISYGLLRYLRGDQMLAEQLRSLPQPEVSFNYMGQFRADDSQTKLFSPIEGDCGPNHSPRQQRDHLLEVESVVIDGKFKLEIVYSRNIHRRETVEALVNGFVSALRLLIVHCQLAEARSYTPSDFPLAKLDQATLSKLAAQLDQFDSPEEHSS